jgi:hypothetical protein
MVTVRWLPFLSVTVMTASPRAFAGTDTTTVAMYGPSSSTCVGTSFDGTVAAA